MNCPACNADNPREAVQCAACNVVLPRRPARRRASQDTDVPDPRTVQANKAALFAYRLSLVGLIPLAGLFLGPAAAVLGAVAFRKSRTDPAFTAHGPVRAAVIIGVIDALTNWVGVVLMVLGLRQALWP